MNRWILAALLGLGPATGALSALEPLPAERVLRKLSLKLTGKSPSIEEQRAFAAEVAADPSQFRALLRSKAAEYLQTEDFRDVVRNFHGVWWQLDPSRESAELASYVIMQGRPYRELFQKDYAYYDGSVAGLYRQQLIDTSEPLPNADGDWRPVRLSPNESRFRSIFSNFDFLNRYPETTSNRNRSRANAVFRLFFCENLAPTVVPGNIELPDDPDGHGSDPDCIGCHYRLDHMARFFDHWQAPRNGSDRTWYDPAPHASGAVVMKRTDDFADFYPGDGESELGRLLWALPEVRSCIVKKGWEFVHGNAALDQETRDGLLADFNSSEDFRGLIGGAIDHPYFWSTEEAPLPNFADVKSSFQVCKTCHQEAGRTEPMFDPLAYPYRADRDENVALLKSIWGSINGKMGYAPMPIPPIPALPVESISSIRDWILNGALTENGEPTLNDEEIVEVLDE